ncbi:hypothetical protein EDD15DRAFT_2200712 [Pisolithus albus]|nr:hypothetical protein EDD15DRAFT_2200712 [Pisolithus albus]
MVLVGSGTRVIKIAMGTRVIKIAIWMTYLQLLLSKVPDVSMMGREVDEDAMSVVVDEEENAECARPGTMSHQNGKGNSPHEPASRSPRSPFPVVGLIPNWHSTAHPLSTQSQPKPKTSNSKPGSQHRIARSTSNPDGALQAGYKSLYGGLGDGDDANDVRTQVSHISSMLLSPRPSPFHLTPNSEPTSLFLRLKKPRTSRPDSAPVNVPSLDAVVERVEHENEPEYQTADEDEQRIDKGDCDGRRIDNARSDREQCSDDNDNDNGDNDNDDPSLPPVISHHVKQSSAKQLNARAFKQGPSQPLKPVVQVFTRSLTHKVPRVGQPSQQVQKSGLLQNLASGAPGCAQGLGRHAVEADEENFESELSEPCRKPQQKACKFRNEDLPGLPYTMAPFCDIVIPHWIFYFSSLDSPWKLANPIHVTYIQKLWNETFPNVKCTVALRNEPIFALVHSPKFLLNKFVLILSEVKQWTYDWRTWAVLEASEVLDDHGHVRPAVPSLFLYMWERVEEGTSGPIPKGTFQHDCILDTFALYLESTSVIRPGKYVPLPKSQQKFSQALWGYATNKVMESVDHLSAKQWKKILLGAEKYVGAYHPQPTLDVLVAKLRKPSGRATCFEADSE